MKLQELRIGNLLKCNDAILEVTEITEKGYKTAHKSGPLNLTFPSENRAEPIPLTEDLLLKAGFNKETDWRIDESRDCFVRDGFCLLVIEGLFHFATSGELGYDEYGIEIKSFHHLQNIVFDLTGQELTLNL